MRILHVIHSIDPRSGGPVESLRGLLRAQIEQGDKPNVYTTDVQLGPRWEDPEAWKVRLQSDGAWQGAGLTILAGQGRSRWARRYRYCPDAATRLRGELAQWRPDFVHIHGLFSHIVHVAAQEAQRAGIPYAIRPAGGLSPFCRRQGFALGKDLLFRLHTRPDARRARFLHATSDREGADLAQLFPDLRIDVVPHGVMIPGDAELARARRNFIDTHREMVTGKVLLFLSRIHPKKGLPWLIEALPSMPGVTLLVAGNDAGGEAEARALVARLRLGDRVHFLGFVRDQLKMELLAGADVVALPSQDENFGMVVPEAMAHGTAVFCGAGVDSSRYVEQAGAGAVVGSLDGVSREALRRLLFAGAESAGAKGRAYARASLGWKPVAARLARLYEV